MAARRDTSEQLHALLRAATGHAIVLTQPDGLVRTFSDGAEEMLGYSAAELVGRHSPDLFFAPGELARAGAELGVPGTYLDVMSASVRAAPTTRDWAWLTSAGQPIIVRLSVTAVLDPDGGFEAHLAIATDVTAEVEATAELAAAETRWRTLLEVLPGAAVLVLDEYLRYESVIGGAFAEGLRTPMILGKSIYEVSSAPDAHLIADLALAALAGEQRTEELVLTAGTYVVVAMPLRNHRGRPQALIFAQDVTAERERERGIQMAQERFRRLFDEAPNGTALVNLAGEFSQVNPMMSRLLDRDADSLVGQPVSSLAATADDQAEIKRYFNDLLSMPSGHLVSDWTVRRGDRQLAYLSAAGAVLLDVEGEAESILINLLDISQRRKMEQRLAHLADHDPLTGLANRRRFDQELSAHLDRCKRYAPAAPLMILDLDHFKEVNDSLGHAAGDQLIVATADALRRRLRTSDVVARMGGDEFAVLLPNVDRSAAEQVAASVVKLIREELQIFDDPTARAVTTSVGVVLIDVPDANAAELLAAADLTMYEAKQAGRDRYAVSQAGVRQPASAASGPLWVDRIAAALSEQHLLLYAQPILNMQTHRYESAELFVRMLYDDNELILPERFLYVAERVGLLPSIDLWVVSQALEWLRRLGSSAPHFQLHVNVSATSMADQGTLDRIAERVGNSKIDPSRLLFEVKEAAAANRLESTRAFTERINDMGCQLALDEFGAGFGSFYYLKHLHFDAVKKISGDMISKSMQSSGDQLILQSVIDLATGLDKRIIAKMVESAAMLDVVTAHEIEFAQGHHLSRPQPVEELLGSIIG